MCIERKTQTAFFPQNSQREMTAGAHQNTRRLKRGVVPRQGVQPTEIKMRKLALTILGVLLITGSTAQMAMASEHHAHKPYRDNFRGAHNQLIAPSYVAPATGNGWNTTGSNWRDDAKFLPAGN